MCTLCCYLLMLPLHIQLISVPSGHAQVTYRYVRQFEYAFLRPPSVWPLNLPAGLPTSRLQQLRADIDQEAKVEVPSMLGELAQLGWGGHLGQ